MKFSQKTYFTVIFSLTFAALFSAATVAQTHPQTPPQTLQPQFHSPVPSATASEHGNAGQPPAKTTPETTANRWGAASATYLKEIKPVIDGIAAAEQASYQLSGRFHLQTGTTQGYLVLECELQPGNYIYSLTQAEPLKPTQIRVAPSEQYALMGNFNPDQSPMVVEKDPIFEQRLEKHKGTVRFFVPFEIAPGVDANQLKPQLVIDGQICSDDGFCMPINAQTVSADFAGYFERTSQK
jgi:hypothetical protein